MNLPDCSHRGRILPRHCFCRHSGQSVAVIHAQCLICDLRDSPPLTQCRHRSDEPIHYEPCSCGDTSKVAIYKCNLHKRCLPLLSDRNRIRDPDARQACQCCEACPDRAPHPMLPVLPD